MERSWYRSSYSLLTVLLLPLSWLFRMIVMLRQLLYRCHIKKVTRFNAPVIVVGNITLGGTGKTPLVIWLAQLLKQQGYKPGIVSRGYGGEKQKLPVFVNEKSLPAEVGDEALLLARRSQCPLVVCVDRVAAVQMLLSQSDCNIVISDDGLQHYRMGRDIEIAVIDGDRRMGNGCMLPAGPLREPVSRLGQVDFVVTQGNAQAGEFAMQLVGEAFVGVQSGIPDNKIFSPGQRIHAVAGIGNPERFFSGLAARGLLVIEHRFPDHYCYKKSDFNFTDQLPIVMTEKDAVKCSAFADERMWYLPVEAKLDEKLGHQIIELLRCKHAN